MKNAILLGLIFIGFSTTVFGDEKDSPITTITNPTYSCGDSKGAFFVDVVNDRIWQGELGSDQGIEHTVIEKRVMRCPHCFSFKTRMLVWGSVLDWQLEIRNVSGTHENPAGSVQLSAQLTSEGETNPPMVMNCNFQGSR